MEEHIINIGLAFFEGFALIVSPCILPIIPIILSGSLTGSKSRPIGIIIGFILTFSIVMLFSRVLIQYADINPEILRNVSFALLLLLGIMMMSTYLTDKFTMATQRLSSVGSQNAQFSRNDFLGGVFFGGLVGIIWTPCAGPILAAVVVQVIIQTTTLTSILTVVAFAIGAGLPMLLIALFGRGIINSVGFLREHTALIRKILGVVIIASVIYFIYTGGVVNESTTTGAPFSSPSLSPIPSPTSSISASPATKLSSSSSHLIDGLGKPFPAPAISGIDAWINSPPLTLNELKGKVVLIDFWTYSCINCIRTLPYLKEWYAKYHQQGFQIIGVHSPEFQFEHNLENVKHAVKKFGILYPVALDNQFVTWRNFYNSYWPAHYLINKEGQVVYIHFGEGKYDVTENNIRFLLGLNKMSARPKKAERDFTQQTPETYLGYARADYYEGNEKQVKDGVGNYTYPQQLSRNAWALKGKWIIYPDKIVSASAGASIKLHFYAAKVYAVMGTGKTPAEVKVLLDGNVLTKEQGRDVKNGLISVSQIQLYSVVDFSQNTEGTLELIVDRSGMEFYTFTFG